MKIALAMMAIFAVNAFAGEARRAAMALEVRFSSIGTGIESNYAEKIESLLVFPKLGGQVEYVRSSGWGFEGESTICIQFKDLATASKLSAEIIALVKNSRLTTAVQKLSCDPNVVPQPNE